MNVRTMITLLEQADPDAEVLLATQPEWPLQFHVSGAVNTDDLLDEEPGEDWAPAVYLVAGEQPAHPYAPRTLWSLV